MIEIKNGEDHSSPPNSSFECSQLVLNSCVTSVLGVVAPLTKCDEVILRQALFILSFEPNIFWHKDSIKS